MKRNFSLFVFVFLATLATIWGCQRTVDKPHDGTVGLVKASVQGRVIDEDNKQPVAGAEVKAGSESTTTDVNGNFVFQNIDLEKNAGFVKVEKEGYFLGSRTFVVNAGSSNKVSIELMRKEYAGTFASTNGGNISLPEGAAINFPGSGIYNEETRAAYNGTVTVAAVSIDPTAENISAVLPGDFRGINANNQERGLQTFGILAVELKGSNDEKLQLANGKTATLRFPIPSELAAQAPATVSLSYFDESKGLWKAEGTAVKEGSFYVGTVTHFSFWSVTADFELVDFTATIKDQNGAAVSNVQVVLIETSDTSATPGIGYSDASGNVSGKIPANKTLRLSVYNDCGEFIGSKNIGPFSTTANIGTVTVTAGQMTTVTITGSVKNCDDQAVTNGYVTIFVDGKNQVAAINNGNFSIAVNRCSSAETSAVITAYDGAGNSQADAKYMSVSTGTANAGVLQACHEFVDFVVNGSSFSLKIPGDTIFASYDQGYHQIVGWNGPGSSSWGSLSLRFTGDTITGSHPLVISDFTTESHQYRKDATTINATITKYGPTGGFIIGSLSGTVRDTMNAAITVPVSCNFRVKRNW